MIILIEVYFPIVVLVVVMVNCDLFAFPVLAMVVLIVVRCYFLLLLIHHLFPFPVLIFFIFALLV